MKARTTWKPIGFTKSENKRKSGEKFLPLFFFQKIHRKAVLRYNKTRLKVEVIILKEYALVSDSKGIMLDPTDKSTAEKLIKEKKADLIDNWPMKIQLRKIVQAPNADTKYPIANQAGLTFVQTGAKRKKIMTIASAGELPPETNRFASVSLYHKKSAAIKSLPPAKNYRRRFEKFLGCTVTIECTNWTLMESKVDNLSCDRLLLVDAMITKCPKKKRINLPMRIQHVWTVIDSGWKERIKPHPLSPLLLEGEVALYANKGFKNVGFFIKNASVREGMTWIS